jgi:site-specific DNA-methyltransferase (adenine-specific)
VTSPPFWFVRDYSVEGQIGLEPSLDDYIECLVDVFSHVRRVLRDDGLLWVNIGDSFTSGGRTWRAPDKKNPNRAMSKRPPTPPNLKKKDLIGIPWRLAFALQQPWRRCLDCEALEPISRWGRTPSGVFICPSCEEAHSEKESLGWHLRAEVIWEKPNAQPESVKDRPTRAHEHLFMLSKSERYFYDNQARRGPNDRNLRSVWSINTSPGRHGHIAPFPEKLVEPCIALSSRHQDFILDPFLGSGTTAVVARRLKRRFVGIELDPKAMRAARARLDSEN